jgi:hypothetical protein
LKAKKDEIDGVSMTVYSCVCVVSIVGLYETTTSVENSCEVIRDMSLTLVVDLAGIAEQKINLGLSCSLIVLELEILVEL